MKNILNEILIKLNYIMSYTYISETQSIMDIFREDQKKDVKETNTNFGERELKEIINYAFRTNKFYYDAQTRKYIVEYKNKEYKIDYKVWMRCISE